MLNRNIDRNVGLFLTKSVEGSTDTTFRILSNVNLPASVWIANDGTTDLTVSFPVNGEVQTMSIKATEQMEIPFLVRYSYVDISIIANSNAYRCQIYQ